MKEADDCIDFGENYIDQDDFSDNGSEGLDLKQADKRAHHNALERKRRDHIKDSFSSLRDAIPLLHGEKINSHKASRAQILKKAAEYIDHMRRKNNDHQKDIDVLKRENKVLEEKIRALEDLKCAGQLKNSNKNQVTSTMTCTRSKNLTINDTSNSTSNNENGGTSILENRIKSESISSFEGNSDYESLNENTETIVQIVKKSNSNNQTNDTSNGTTLLLPNQAIVNNSVIKKKINTQTKSNILLGPPNKRKRLNGMTIIAANTSIISK